MIAGSLILVIGIFVWNYLYYYAGVVYLSRGQQDVACISQVRGDTLYLKGREGFQKFEIRGVNLGFSKPGYYATEDAVSREEYLSWIRQIKEMGANVIGVETMGPKAFYDALYEFNEGNKDPVYLIQGIAIDEYLVNSIYGALDEEFYKPFARNCKKTVDAVHGRLKTHSDYGLFPTHYNRDVSPWVYGYILGGEWETTLVAYTDRSFEQQPQFEGKYLCTRGAGNFEIFLAEMGDELISYEMEKYGAQKTISFGNWTMTDPLSYGEELEVYFKKAAKVDTEHIKSTEQFVAGQFASYHVYPAYPDFYSYMDVHEMNTYRQYLKALNAHHSMPVVISGFGASSARTLSAEEKGLGRNMGRLNETQQGEAVISMYDDIRKAGCAGGIIYEWQDEWYKTTWNCVAGVNSEDSPYWVNRQSCDAFYGLLAFEPGEKESICCVDGKISEWGESDLVLSRDGIRLYMKYDEACLYFMVEQKGYDFCRDHLYIPIDITPKSGSKTAQNLGISMNRAADFCIEINGRNNSRVWVQDRYNMLSALFNEEISAQDFFSKEFPKKDSPVFSQIHMLLQEELYYETEDLESEGSPDDRRITFREYDSYNPYHYKVKACYETGKLHYGNGDPGAEDYDSLTDFCSGEDCVEIRIPWQLLNVADPVKMFIHDDYYENYGVEYLSIDRIAAGAGDGSCEIKMEWAALKPLGKSPAYHERRKKSYEMIREYWKAERSGV